MLDKFYKKEDLIEIQDDNNRFGVSYKFPDKDLVIDCPSVTQVTSQLIGMNSNNPHLQAARSRGTTIHKAIEMLLLGSTDTEVTEYVSTVYPDALPFWKSGIKKYLNTIEKVHSIEAFSYYDFTEKAKLLDRFDKELLEKFTPLMVRGSYDLHAHITGRERIVDWKTSKAKKSKKDILNYLIQVSTYVLIGNKTYNNITECFDIVMIYPRAEPDVITVDKEDMNYYCNLFLRHLYNYYVKRMNDGSRGARNCAGFNENVGDKFSTLV